MNPINKKYHKCFQYPVTVALIHEKNFGYPERITKIKPFINKYNCEEIKYPSEKGDLKKFQKRISLLLLMSCTLKTISKHSKLTSTCKKNKLIFL